MYSKILMCIYYKEFAHTIVEAEKFQDLKYIANAGEVGSIPSQGPKIPHATAQPRD